MQKVFEEIIEELRKEKDVDRSKVYSPKQCDAIRYSFGAAIDTVKKAALEYDNGWIPVEKRLPNRAEYLRDDGRFILDDGNRRYQGSFDIYDGKFKFTTHISGLHYEFCDDNCVTAWQPLPEPYNPEEVRGLTNADRIRAMSDEELAEFIMDVAMGVLFKKKIMNVKAWLQSEVEVSDE